MDNEVHPKTPEPKETNVFVFSDPKINGVVKYENQPYIQEDKKIDTDSLKRLEDAIKKIKDGQAHSAIIIAMDENNEDFWSFISTGAAERSTRFLGFLEIIKNHLMNYEFIPDDEDYD